MSKLALIITGLGMGGAECQVVNLVDKFSSAGHEVLLIALTGNAIILPTNPKVRVECIGMRKTILGFFCAYRRVRRLISDFSPDVVHSHMVHANVFTRLLRLTISIPRLICTAHSSNEGNFLRMLAYRLTDRLADISTNVSINAVTTLIEKNAFVASRSIVVHNGIDTESFSFNSSAREYIRRELKITKHQSLLLAVGRLTEAKDYPNLLTAFSMVANTNSDVQLAIVGTGNLLESLQKKLEELGISERVHFLGLRHDIPALMSAADIFILSSAWEGFGLVVAEAMACERLIVATDCGGVREVVGDTQSLVPPCNAEKLAQAINHALVLPHDERVTRGIAARQRILTYYSLDSIVARWLEIYQLDKIEIISTPFLS